MKIVLYTFNSLSSLINKIYQYRKMFFAQICISVMTILWEILCGNNTVYSNINVLA